MPTLTDALPTTLTLTNQPTSAWTTENSPHPWHASPSSLSSTNTPHTFSVSTGYEIYKSSLLPAIESASSEVILATCFWASSATLSALNASLKRLSQKAQSRNDGRRIRVYLCFSSHSLFQKLFHTKSPMGKVYPPAQWGTLGLPSPEEVPGLDVTVKSLFFRPFSVMHPKFVIVDRRVGYMPSCNVSWEDWLECCVSFSGSTVTSLVQFFEHFWIDGKLPELPAATAYLPSQSNLLSGQSTETILLPHQHHASLRASMFVLPTPPVPLTPLNIFLLHVLTAATTSIFILSPNLTSPPVLSALLAALERGVNVHVVSNRRMMLLEQLVTAGTVTELCIWSLIRSYNKIIKRQRTRTGDVEQGRRSVGALRVEYFQPKDERIERHRDEEQGETGTEPVKCHIKCTIVDDRIVVLGSGNMDRASWFTSQELGIGFMGAEVVARVRQNIDRRLKGRVEKYFPKW